MIRADFTRPLATMVCAALLAGGCMAPQTTQHASPLTSSPSATRSPAATTTARASPSPPPAPSPSPTPSHSPSPFPSPTPTSSPAFDPTSIVIAVTPFVSRLSAPVFATGRRDGSGGLFVVEQPGRVRSVDADGTLQPTAVLDLTDRVLAGGERGLLGLALHPDYEENGLIYVNYTRKPDGATIVSEFRVVGGVADRTQERILLNIVQPFPNHNGGMIAFDSEGMLVIGMGDGGSGGDPNGNGQNPQALLGKMLRIDVNGDPYGIPDDNPFAGSTTTAPEIWDLGMRNPWRFSFDRQTGDLWIGDVGQGTWEEVDAEPALQGGRNYGWNIMEGDHCLSGDSCDATGLTPPVLEYDHSGGGCVVTGGYVYRGAAFPMLSGAYIFGDFCLGTISTLDAAWTLAGGAGNAAVAVDTGLAISSFGEDDAGELYAVDLRGGIYKLSARAR